MDRDARFENIYRRFYRPVSLYFTREFKLPPDDASDLAQDVFVQVYRSLDDYRGEAEWPFIQAVAKRVALNTIRARTALKRNTSVEVINAEAVRLSAVSTEVPATQEHEVATHEMAVRLRDAIDTLPPATQSVLLLLLNDLSYAEIAQSLGITADAVKSRLRTAKLRLREQLSVEPFGPRLVDESLDNVVRFPSSYSSLTSITPDLSDEQAYREFDEKLSIVTERLHQLQEQIVSFSDMLRQHDSRIGFTTAPVVASVRVTTWA